MEKEYISYEQALALKELGFDEPCIATIDQTEYLHIKGTENHPRGSMIYDTIDIPLYQQAFRWFRDKHGLPSWIKEFNGARICYHFTINPQNGGSWDSLDNKLEYKTYEEAELKCLKKLIEIVKSKK